MIILKVEKCQEHIIEKGKYKKETTLKIECLIDKELKFANEFFEQFNSSHEAMSVIKEEFEESTNGFKDLNNFLERYWNLIKNPVPVYLNQSNSRIDCLKEIKILTIVLIKELIQVGAMAQKGIDFEEKQKKSIERVIENMK